MTPDKLSARQRILAEAERQFMEKGYASVTLRDIAKAVGIRHASLYHHVPGGKPALFVEVMQQSMARHAAGMQASRRLAEQNIHTQLVAVAQWFVSQPPIDVIRLTQSDLRQLEPDVAYPLMHLVYDSLLQPISDLLQQAQERGEVSHPNLGLIAGSFLAMVQSLHAIPPFAIETSLSEMAEDLVSVLLNGIAS